jgi:hypothetical protein
MMPLSIKKILGQESSLAVYPNPTKDKVITQKLVIE